MTENFSTIKIPKGLCLGKQLTGSPRIFKDHCIDFYNYVQDFNSRVICGLSIIQKITELVLKKINNGYLSDVDLQRIHNELQELSEELSPEIEKMEASVTKLRKIVNQLKSLQEIMIKEHIKVSDDFLNEEEPVPWQTWPVSRFSEKLSYVAAMYYEEFQLKQYIASNICHQTIKDNVKFLVVCWKYQCKVKKSENDFNAFAIECGFK